jgi:hypothetical protein
LNWRLKRIVWYSGMLKLISAKCPFYLDSARATLMFKNVQFLLSTVYTSVTESCPAIFRCRKCCPYQVNPSILNWDKLPKSAAYIHV